MGRVARGHVDRRRVFAEGFPHHAAPAGFEGADHVVGFVGGWRRGQDLTVQAVQHGKLAAEAMHAQLMLTVEAA